MNELIQKVISWVKENDLIDKSDSKTLTLNLVSKAGGLSRSIAIREDCRDAIGNCFIVIITLSTLEKYNIAEFIERSDLSKIDDNHDSISSFMYELWQGFGRLSDAINKGDTYNSTLDDLLITLSGIAGFYNYLLEECLEIAYNNTIE